MIRILVAPDSFKGSIAAIDAARAIERGVLRALPDAEVDACPLADGGEGTLDVLARAKGGEIRTTRVHGSRGTPVWARWALLSDGSAIVEAAEAVGLELVPKGERNPMALGTFGVGELILEALGAGARSVVVALGGTGTVDLGAGLAQALGVEFEGAGHPITAADLGAVRNVDRSRVDPRVKTAELRVAVDVDNPLLGTRGAAAVYAPQKGATPEQVAALERSFSHIERLVGDPGNCPGDGAAGGMAYLLRSLFGATLESGAALVQCAVGFSERLKGVDLVLTGEGRVDGQTAQGKVVAAVGRAAKAAGVPAVALAGSIRDDARILYDQGIAAMFSLCDGPVTEAEAKARAAPLLEKLSENVVRFWLGRRPG